MSSKISEREVLMPKAYNMALVKFTDRDSFMQNYASKVADVFPNIMVTF